MSVILRGARLDRHDNPEYLAMIEMVMGKMPDCFACAGSRAKPEFFKEGGRLDWPKAKASRQSEKDVRATHSLQDVILLTDNINRHSLVLPKSGSVRFLGKISER
jgi:dual-specificity kinase